MKCIQEITSSKIVRTNNEAAAMKVASGDWTYIAKKEWKEKVRDSKLTDNNNNHGRQDAENKPIK